MYESLSTNVKVYGSRVWVNLVDKMVPMVDQVLLQVAKPETAKLLNWKMQERKNLQYSITTSSSLFFRLVVQAPIRLTMFRCLLISIISYHISPNYLPRWTMILSSAMSAFK